MSKSKSTFLEVAAESKRKGDKVWAQAKQAEKEGDNGKATNLYNSARGYYATEKKAKESASKATD